MGEWTLNVTDADIDRALEDAKGLPARPRAVSAVYGRDLDVVILGLNDGQRLFIPREQLQGLEEATPEQLADIQIFGGFDVAWPQLDVDHHIDHLLAGQYATEQWKQQQKEKHAVAA